MARSRLSTALTDGHLSIPESGDVALVRPPAGYDAGGLPAERLTVVHGFRPDAAYWEAMGHDVETDMPRAAMTIIVVPRSKRLARALVAEAAAQGGVVVVDGQKTDGVDGLYREVRGRVGDLPSLTKAHGRLFSFDASAADFSDWRGAGPVKGPHGFFTYPGVFSEDGIDAGSELLAGALPDKLGPRVADLGSGWGYLTRAVLDRAGVTHVDAIEAECLAVEAARLNVTDARVQHHWSDVTRFEANEPFDTIVTNPPFHTSRKADAGLGLAFINAAARMLAPTGDLWLVANRHLPYETGLNEAFRIVEERDGSSAFKIFRAARPIRAETRTRLRRR